MKYCEGGLKKVFLQCILMYRKYSRGREGKRIKFEGTEGVRFEPITANQSKSSEEQTKRAVQHIKQQQSTDRSDRSFVLCARSDIGFLCQLKCLSRRVYTTTLLVVSRFFFGDFATKFGWFFRISMENVERINFS